MTDYVDDTASPLKSTTAYQRSLHFNAPHSVVDPLISLLYDLRRIEESIFSSLVEMGVDVHALPRPIRPTASTPAPAVPTRSSPPAKDEGPPKESFLSRYARAAFGKETCTVREKAEAVESVLTYLDAHHPPSGEARAVEETAAEGRRLLSALVAASDTGEQRPVWVDDRPVAETAPPLKKCRKEAPLRVVHSTDDVPQAQTTTLFGEYTAADVARMLGEWAHYENGLSLAMKDMKPLLRALCASTIAGSLSSHAKWIEVDKEDLHKPLPLPSSAKMRQAAEEVIAMNDALATVQVPVHAAYTDLVRAVEEYTAECVVVGEHERHYWENMEKFELEYRAIKEMKSRIGKIRNALQQCLN